MLNILIAAIVVLQPWHLRYHTPQGWSHLDFETSGECGETLDAVIQVHPEAYCERDPFYV